MTDAAWVALSLTGRIGSKTLRALLDHFENASAVIAADSKALQKVPGVGPKIAQSIREIDLECVEQAIPGWAQDGVRIMTQQDPNYPERLRALDDAPPTLFMRGDGHFTHSKYAALVGTRNPSPEGRKTAQNLASNLVEQGYIIVSGLAVGVDAAAHMGALALPQGCTLAVLGCGVLNIYPSDNQSLAKAVAGRGLLLSEVNPQATPSSSTLVARNRIISGLSDVLIVIETAVDGGAMHAARFAKAQGRTVYAIDCPASGNQALIAAGATSIAPDLSNLPF